MRGALCWLSPAGAPPQRGAFLSPSPCLLPGGGAGGGAEAGPPRPPSAAGPLPPPTAAAGGAEGPAAVPGGRRWQRGGGSRVTWVTAGCLLRLVHRPGAHTTLCSHCASYGALPFTGTLCRDVPSVALWCTTWLAPVIIHSSTLLSHSCGA